MALVRPAPVPMQGKAVARETHLQGFMPAWGDAASPCRSKGKECRTTIFQGSDSKALETPNGKRSNASADEEGAQTDSATDGIQ